MKFKPHKPSVGNSLTFLTAIGAGISLLISILLSLLLASFIVEGKAGEGIIITAAHFTRALSVFVGGLISAKMAEGKSLPVVVMVTATYLLLIIALGISIYGNSFQGFIGGVVSALSGGVITALIVLKPTTKKHVRHKYAK